MRGSPLVNALLVVLAVIGCGIGLRSLTGQPAAPPTGAVPPPAARSARQSAIRFELLLSHPARSVRLDPGDAAAALDLASGPGPHRGLITLDPAHPVVFIDIEWEDPATTSHHFAKLTLEPPDQTTLSHTFDSTGPLSDVWEIQSAVIGQPSSGKGTN